MRNKRETDISQYKERVTEKTPTATAPPSGAKRFFKGLGKAVLTVFAIGFVSMVIAGVSMGIYIFSLASEPTGINLAAKSLNQTSFIYVQNEDSGEFEQYKTLYSTENRIWVDNQDIPQAMKDAQVAIEDKRFFEHHGVDWFRTMGAMVNLASDSGSSYGGSTLTQQLIKNITDDNEVSITRKLREICKALKLEQEYTKDQILEAYLNVVNFGNNCQGVEAAAQLYFDKSIKECSIAECAAIAGITQNPSLWNPLVYPENNKQRRELVLQEMLEQEYITQSEYDQAMEESANMTFVGYQSSDDDEEEDYVQNWYIDQLYYDLKADLAQYYNISEDAASDMLYTEGLKIYCAMDLEMQDYIEQAALDMDKTADPEIQMGSVLMDFDGRVIATVGSSKKKTTALEWDRATHSALQSGSSIKPVLVYPIAIENKLLYFSSMVLDEPLAKYQYDESSGTYISGPSNWYMSYKGNMLLPDAIEISSNATAVQVMELIGGPSVAYEQAVTKMGFSHLNEEDAQITGSLSIGGMSGGVSVREMAAAYTYMGNGGLYYEPYTYYYVTDSEGNIIIDKRDAVPKQAYSAETATIMNRLLHYNVTNSVNTQASLARVSGWDIIGKTGTTNYGSTSYDKDAWFCGMSPYAVMATWTGFDQPDIISDTSRPITFFSKIMTKYLESKEAKEYKLSENCFAATYDPSTGMITSTEYTSGKYVGYYTEDNMPSYSSGYLGDSNYSFYGSESSAGSDSNNNNNYSNDDNGSGDTDWNGENSSGGENSGADTGGETSGDDAGGGDAGGDTSVADEGGGDADGGNEDGGENAP